MSLIPAGFAEATFIFAVTGKVRNCTWSLGLDCENFGILSPEEIAEQCWSAFGVSTAPYVAGQIAVGWSFLGVSVTKQLEEGPISGQFLQTVTGTVAVGPLPVNCALLFNKQTGGGGRRNRGRAYVPPVHLSEADIGPIGQITADTSSLQGRYNDAIANLLDENIQPVLFHQTAPFTPTNVSALVLQSVIATQRRRMRS